MVTLVEKPYGNTGIPVSKTHHMLVKPVMSVFLTGIVTGTLLMLKCGQRDLLHLHCSYRPYICAVVTLYSYAHTQL